MGIAPTKNGLQIVFTLPSLNIDVGTMPFCRGDYTVFFFPCR